MKAGVQILMPIFLPQFVEYNKSIMLYSKNIIKKTLV